MRRKRQKPLPNRKSVHPSKKGITLVVRTLAVSFSLSKGTPKSAVKRDQKRTDRVAEEAKSLIGRWKADDVTVSRSKHKL